MVTVDHAVIVDALQRAGLPDAPVPQPIDAPPPAAAGLTVTSGLTDDPVSAATGNFVEHEVDLLAPARLHLLQWARVYHSRFLAPGPLGQGWASWATTRLEIAERGITYHGPDGQQVVVTRDGSGGTFAPPTLAAALVAGDDGGVTLAWVDGQRWSFDADGALLAGGATGSADTTAFEARKRRPARRSAVHASGHARRMLALVRPRPRS